MQLTDGDGGGHDGSRSVVLDSAVHTATGLFRHSLL